MFFHELPKFILQISLPICRLWHLNKLNQITQQKLLVLDLFRKRNVIAMLECVCETTLILPLSHDIIGDWTDVRTDRHVRTGNFLTNEFWGSYQDVDALPDFLPFVQFKGLKKNHGGALLLANFTATFPKITLLHGCFNVF